MNEEFLVSASHQLALITSLPFVHTACCYYRLNGLVRSSDWRYHGFIDAMDAEKLTRLDHLEEVKVVTRFPVGEPAEVSLPFVNQNDDDKNPQ